MRELRENTSSTELTSCKYVVEPQMCIKVQWWNAERFCWIEVDMAVDNINKKNILEKYYGISWQL